MHSIYNTEHEILSREEELELIKKYQSTGCKQSIDRLVACNVLLVYKCARKSGLLNSYPDGADDIIQNGMLGLIKAIKKFDTSRGIKLSTYSVNWINQSMLREVQKGEFSTNIGYPVHHSRVASILRHIMKTDDVDERNCYALYILECAAREVDVVYGESQIIESFLFMQTRTFSGNEQYGDISDSDYGCYFDLVDDGYQSPEELHNGVVVENLVKQMIDEVGGHSKAMRLRFGIETYHEQTLEEVGVQFGVTRECVRLWENKHLSLYRTWLHWNGYEKLSDIL